MGEKYFDAPDPGAAFAQVRAKWEKHDQRLVAEGTPRHDFDYTLNIHFGKTDLSAIAEAVKRLILPIWGSESSIVCLLQLCNYERSLLDLAKKTSGVEQQHLVSALASLPDSYAHSLPPTIVAAFESADPADVFAQWEQFFDSYAHAHSTVQLILIAASYNIERLFLAGFRAAGLKRCVWMSVGIRGLLREDRKLRFVHYMLAPALFKVGSELIKGVSAESTITIQNTVESDEDKEARKARVLEYKTALQIIVLCLEGLGKKYGLNIRVVADALTGLAASAEILHEHVVGKGAGEVVRAPTSELGSSVSASSSSAGEAKFFADVLKEKLDGTQQADETRR
jgi:hypothetical protein